MGGGAILDLGVYMLQFQQFVFRGLKPIKVVATGHLNKCGTDESCGAVITYPDGKMAMVSTSARVLLTNEGVIVGTKGIIKLPKFWCPTELIMPNGEVKTYALPDSKVPFLHTNSAGLCYQAEAARQCIARGELLFRKNYMRYSELFLRSIGSLNLLYLAIQKFTSTLAFHILVQC